MFNRRLGFLNGSTSATTKHNSLLKNRVEKIRYVDSKGNTNSSERIIENLNE